jgi:hypothetical protein
LSVIVCGHCSEPLVPIIFTSFGSSPEIVALVCVNGHGSAAVVAGLIEQCQSATDDRSDAAWGG